MKKILFITTVPLHITDNGGVIYSKSIVDLLKNNYKVDVLSYRKYSYSKYQKNLYQFFSIVRSWFSFYPSKVHYFKSHSFKQELVETLQDSNYSYVVIDHAEMLWVLDILKQFKDKKSIHISHNLEHILYNEYIKQLPIFLQKFFQRDVQKYTDYELQYINKVKNIICISDDDMKYFNSTIENLNALVLPVSFNNDSINKKIILKNENQIRLCFLGNLNWWPNRKGLIWFIEKVFLNIMDSRIQLHIYGKGSDTLNYVNQNIIQHGFVDDINEIWNDNNIFIHPIFSGSGMNIKVAETIFRDKPMLCTNFAVRGFNIVKDDAIIFLNKENEWIEFLNFENLNELKNCKVRKENKDLFISSKVEKKIHNYIKVI